MTVEGTHMPQVTLLKGIHVFEETIGIIFGIQMLNDRWVRKVEVNERCLAGCLFVSLDDGCCFLRCLGAGVPVDFGDYPKPGERAHPISPPYPSV